MLPESQGVNGTSELVPITMEEKRVEEDVLEEAPEATGVKECEEGVEGGISDKEEAVEEVEEDRGLILQPVKKTKLSGQIDKYERESVIVLKREMRRRKIQVEGKIWL